MTFLTFIRYPANLPVAALLETLHKDKISAKARMKYFYISFAVLFFWQVFPQYISKQLYAKASSNLKPTDNNNSASFGRYIYILPREQKKSILYKPFWRIDGKRRTRHPCRIVGLANDWWLEKSLMGKHHQLSTHE
jgi:hypothetical protein